MKSASWNNAKIFSGVFGIVLFIILAFLLLKPSLKCFYPIKYAGEIKESSEKYKINKELTAAIISAESKFQKNAVSHKNAKGLMQLKEETAKWCMEKYKINGDVKNIYSPSLNIKIGCAYMSYLLEKFENEELALAAYNAGEGNVKKWIKAQGEENLKIPFKETKKYVETVKKREKIYKFLYFS